MTASKEKEHESGGKRSGKKKRYLFIFLVLFSLFAFWYVADTSSPNDSHLDLPPLVGIGQVDYFIELARLGEEVEAEKTGSEYESLDFEGLDLEDGQRLLQSILGKLSRIQEIIDSEKLFSVPLTNANGNEGLYVVIELLKLRASCRFQSGDSSGALQDCFRLAKFSHSLSSGNANLSSLAVSGYAVGYVTDLLSEGLHKNGGTSEATVQLGKDMSKLRLTMSDYERGIRDLYQDLKGQVLTPNGSIGDKARRIFLKPNKTLHMIQPFFETLISDLRKKRKDREYSAMLVRWDARWRYYAHYVLDNVLGWEFVSFRIGFMQVIPNEYDEYNYFHSVNQVFLAMYAYSKDFGRLPNTIAELSPSYLASVPVNASGDPIVDYDQRGLQLLPADASLAQDRSRIKAIILSLAFPHLNEKSSTGQSTKEPK